VRKPRRLIFALMGLAVVAHAAHTQGAGKPELDNFFEVWLYTAIELAATVILIERAVRVPEERLAWAMIAANLVLWGGGDAYWDFYLVNQANQPFPSFGDWLYLASYVPFYIGVVLLLRARMRPFRLSLWLDGAIAGLSWAALTAALVFEPVRRATHGSTSVVAVTLAYPVLDLIIIALVLVGFGLANWRPDRGLILLGLGGLATGVGDAIYTYQASAGTYSDGTIVNTTWPLAFVLIAAAGWQFGRRRVASDHGLRTAVLPAISTLLALGLLGYADFAHIGHLAAILAIFALLLGLARVGIMWAENLRLLAKTYEEAHVDGLSGLPNRRMLMNDLEHAAGAAHEGGPVRLVFFDLDGFKGYNDAFGHAAGDALLRRLGAALRVAVHEPGRAYRLGGDEFCVLLQGTDDNAVAAAADALREQGPEFSISPSFGVVDLPKDTSDPAQALQLADERMYEQKNSGRASSRRQTRDVLLQVLSEREPDLNSHADGVTAYAIALGRKVGVVGEELDVLARAAELHDIGKVAIPEAILQKPAALDEDEWALMREHTVIGERIVAAAPALRPVARLVRASHERWDGAGYPDGLRAGEIPLGARVIAICDAFDAMTSNRPYSAPRRLDEAMAELRRCAGRQFDPELVAAFSRLDIASLRDERTAVAR
jgi:two-component system, cell cycle response regulator